jgi:hypothetical protein
MSTSNVQIANNALIRIGASSIISFTENSEAARAVNLIFSQVRNAVLRDHIWNFALRRVQLALNDTAPAFGYGNSFALPTDCLRVIQMEEKDMVYVIEGRNLLTDEGTAKIIYLAEITDPTQYDPMFVEALSARLAAELAIPLADSNSLYQNMMEVYRMKITDARSIDGQESGEPQIVADTWLDSRLNYAASLTVDVNGTS